MILLAARSFLAAVLAVAAVAKLMDRREQRRGRLRQAEVCDSALSAAPIHQLGHCGHRQNSGQK